MKFVIEIDDKPIVDENGKQLFKAKGFNSLVFDQYGLNHLNSFDKEYEDRKDEERNLVANSAVQIGDEVASPSGHARMIVTRINANGEISGFGVDGSGLIGSVFSCRAVGYWKKTGKHNRFIKMILEQMQKERDYTFGTLGREENE